MLLSPVSGAVLVAAQHAEQLVFDLAQFAGGQPHRRAAHRSRLVPLGRFHGLAPLGDLGPLELVIEERLGGRLSG